MYISLKGCMQLKMLIHDLETDMLRGIFPSNIDKMTIISDDGTRHHCIGCFGCWVKTPGACVIRDQYGDMGECLSKCSEITILSRCFYGGFSPFVKKVLDRSISYVHPYFVIRNGEMHHKFRYNKSFALNVMFYGENITAQEKQTAEKLVHAIALNLGCKVQQISFIKDAAEIGYAVTNSYSFEKEAAL